MDDDDDFERVGHTGGLVTFNIAGPSEHRSFAIQIQHASAGHAAAIFGITVASDFVPVSPLQMGGLVTTPPDTPPPVARFIPVYILSDKEGFIGRRCPRCTHYFRTHSHGAETTCPYCGARTGSHLFLSEGQRNYVRH